MSKRGLGTILGALGAGCGGSAGTVDAAGDLSRAAGNMSAAAPTEIVLEVK